MSSGRIGIASIAATLVAAFVSVAAAQASPPSLNLNSLASAQSSLNATRQLLGVPAANVTPSACPDLLAFDPLNPFPGRPDRLVAALAPQTTALDGCLNATQSGYRTPASDKLIPYPADGTVGVALGAPLVVFAQGPFVEQPATSNPTYANVWRMRTSVDAATLIRVRDDAPVSLAADDASFTLYPGWTLTPTQALSPATSYRASVTLSSAYGSKTISWNFQTKGASGVLAGSASSTSKHGAGRVNVSLSGDTLRVTLSKPGVVKLLLRRPNGTWAHVSRTLGSTSASLSLAELFGSLDSGRYTLQVLAATGQAALDFNIA
jgi:hypothetical protein